MTARRAWRQLVVDPVVGLAGNYPTLVALGYRVRPFDMLADRRRWFWQRPHRCGLPSPWGRLEAVISRALVEGAAQHAQWTADNPADAARWRTQLDAIDRAHGRGREARRE